MNWLQATLAFALVMLVLATIVTLLLETGYQLLSTRERGFRLMMERLFDEVLRARVAPLLRGATVEQARNQFLRVVTRNQAYDRKPGRLRGLAQSGDLASMTMMQFADRLADTEVGKAIARAGAEHVNIAINDLAQKFERFGQASSQRFLGQARFWCVLVSILVAFVANIDAVRVFQSLLRDDTLTNSVIARYGSTVDDQAERPQSVHASLEILSKLHDENVVSDDQLKRFKESIASAHLKMADLQEAGLPVTAEYWPFCTGAAARTGPEPPRPTDPKCASATASLLSWTAVHEIFGRIFTSTGAAWFLSVLLAGMLIGLGAPFWFDLARGLTRTAQLLKAVGGVDKSNSAPEAASALNATASPPPRTPVEAFTVAIAASRSTGWRVLLSPSGKPMRGI